MSDCSKGKWDEVLKFLLPYINTYSLYSWFKQVEEKKMLIYVLNIYLIYFIIVVIFICINGSLFVSIWLSDLFEEKKVVQNEIF